jgi:hypothetical protein
MPSQAANKRFFKELNASVTADIFALLTGAGCAISGVLAVVFTRLAVDGTDAATICSAVICGLLCIVLAITCATLRVIAHIYMARMVLYRVDG